MFNVAPLKWTPRSQNQIKYAYTKTVDGKRNCPNPMTQYITPQWTIAAVCHAGLNGFCLHLFAT